MSILKNLVDLVQWLFSIERLTETLSQFLISPTPVSGFTHFP
jgi:hypothetical protein